MSTTQGPTEPVTGVPPGAIPQPPSRLGSHPDRDGFARSGDTDVVFRLERDVPLVHRVRELASAAVEGLIENWRLVLAGVVVLAALAALWVAVGGAYGGHTSPPVAPAAAAPVPPPPAAAPLPQPTPAAPAVAAPADEVAPPPPAIRPRVRTSHTRNRTPAAKKHQPAAHPPPSGGAVRPPVTVRPPSSCL